jgi:hypothetical protein
MIIQYVYHHPEKINLNNFDFAQDGRDTLQWLQVLWSFQKNKKARSAAAIFGRKMRAWEKNKKQEKNNEKARIESIHKLNKMLRGDE